MQPNVIPLTPKGHFFQQLYHKTARGMSSPKTSSLFWLLTCTELFIDALILIT